MSGFVVVGVTPLQPAAVVLSAAELAHRYEAELVCAYVSEPLPPPVDPLQRLPELLLGRNVRWSTRRLAGEPVRALTDLADSLGALLIVVGTKRPVRKRRPVRDALRSPLAMRLTTTQHRPVVVVPLGSPGVG